MSTNKPYLTHLSQSNDLITPREQIRAGFVSLALERNSRATPFIQEARNLKMYASTAKNPHELLNIPNIKFGLLTAAGVSDKASGHMEPQDKDEAVNGLLKNFLEPAGNDFVEELVYRFLLTRGDTLGGSMRNWGGERARQKLSRSIIGALTLAGISFNYLNSLTNTWEIGDKNMPDIERHTKGLNWAFQKNERTLIFDKTIPLVGRKNVDLILLNCGLGDLTNQRRLISQNGIRGNEVQIPDDPSRYIALGELKGGIDPAGADEHWKTAGSALSRIRQAFLKRDCSPLLIFVGAAIERHMAGEIWNDLLNGKLHNVANLTNDDQLASLCNWLCQI